MNTEVFIFLQDLQVKKRADERTRTAYPCSLRVILQALQGVAEACKCRIYKRLSLLRFAECCTILRSPWYQSGIKTSRLACSDSRSLSASKTVIDGSRTRSGSRMAGSTGEPMVAG